MLKKKKVHPIVKAKMHPKNKHRERYDFEQLTATCPELASFVRPNEYQDISIDFSDPLAVKMLNKAILKHFYKVENWDIPEGYLCPPVPGRADYMHHMADILQQNNYGKIPTGPKIKCLDIGVGANCIYPLIGNMEYGWSFIGSDIDPVAIESANKIITLNPHLIGLIECHLQKDPKDFFYGITKADELIDFTVCNPPFHASAEEAQAATLRKLSNLNQKKIVEDKRNFGGNSNELWCNGGEARFVRNMIHQSKKFSTTHFWFSSLISKQSNLKSTYETLKELGATKIETKEMGQGNKTSRIVAWTFLSDKEQQKWKKERW